MDKSKYHDGVVIFFTDCNDIKIIMFVEIKQMILFIFYDWFKGVFIILKNLFIKSIINVAWEIRAEMPGNEYSSFFIKDINSRNATHLFKF